MFCTVCSDAQLAGNTQPSSAGTRPILWSHKAAQDLQEDPFFSFFAFNRAFLQPGPSVQLAAIGKKKGSFKLEPAADDCLDSSKPVQFTLNGKRRGGRKENGENDRKTATATSASTTTTADCAASVALDEKNTHCLQNTSDYKTNCGWGKVKYSIPE